MNRKTFQKKMTISSNVRFADERVKRRARLPTNYKLRNLFEIKKKQRSKSLPTSFRYKLTAWRLKHLMRSNSRSFQAHRFSYKFMYRQETIKLTPLSDGEEATLRRKSCECSECGPQSRMQKIAIDSEIQQKIKEREHAQQSYNRTAKKQHQMIKNPYLIFSEGKSTNDNDSTSSPYPPVQSNQIHRVNNVRCHSNVKSYSTLELTEEQKSNRRSLKQGKKKNKLSLFETFFQKQRFLMQKEMERKNTQFELLSRLPTLSIMNTPRQQYGKELSKKSTRETTISKLYMQNTQRYIQNRSPQRVQTLSDCNN